MTSTDITPLMEAGDLSRGREMVQMVLREWDWMTWNALLADDVVLSINLGAVGIDHVGGFDFSGANARVTGREDARAVLRDIYGELKQRLSVTTEVVRGYDVVLLGDCAPIPTKENVVFSSLPIALYLAFDHEGKIRELTIAAVDLNPLVDAVQTAARTGASHPS